MKMPDPLRRQLDDLERRYDGPIPAAARRDALLPTCAKRMQPAEIESCIAYFEFQCRSRWTTLKAVAHWAAASRRASGVVAIIDREKFRLSANRLIDARHARAAWRAARSSHRETRGAERP